MITLIGISGSLRKQSFNSGLLRAAVEAAPDHCSLTIGTIKGIPLYNADVQESEGIPTAIEGLKSLIADADGLLMVTPENNNSIPGVFKNAIDWLTSYNQKLCLEGIIGTPMFLCFPDKGLEQQQVGEWKSIKTLASLLCPYYAPRCSLSIWRINSKSAAETARGV